MGWAGGPERGPGQFGIFFNFFGKFLFPQLVFVFVEPSKKHQGNKKFFFCRLRGLGRNLNAIKKENPNDIFGERSSKPLLFTTIYKNLIVIFFFLKKRGFNSSIL